MTGKNTYGKLDCPVSLPAPCSGILECMKQEDHPFISGAAEAIIRDDSYAGLANHQAAAIGRCATSFVHDGVYIIMDGGMAIASTSRLKDAEAACWTVEVLKFCDISEMSFEHVDGDKQIGTLQVDYKSEDAKPVRCLLRYMHVEHFRLLQTLVDESRGKMN